MSGDEFLSNTSGHIDTADLLLCNLYYKNNAFALARFEIGEIYLYSRMLSTMEMVKQCHQLNKLIQQTIAILNHYNTKLRKWLGGIGHLEAERILAISMIRFKMLTRAAHQNIIRLKSGAAQESSSSGIHATIIKQIEWLHVDTRNSMYFIFCILYSDVTVYSSDVRAVLSIGNAKFYGPYRFKNITEPGRIKMKVFGIQFIEKSIKRTNDGEMPIARLLATAKINLDDISRGQGNFQYVYLR